MLIEIIYTLMLKPMLKIYSTGYYSYSYDFKCIAFMDLDCIDIFYFLFCYET